MHEAVFNKAGEGRSLPLRLIADTDRVDVRVEHQFFCSLADSTEKGAEAIDPQLLHTCFFRKLFE